MRAEGSMGSCRKALSDLWQDAWNLARSAARSGRKDDDDWREPFQLLVAALVYNREALMGHPADKFDVLAPLAFEGWGAALLGPEPPPAFGPAATWVEEYGSMHLSSASFRISTAVFLVQRSVQPAGSPFGRLTSKRDWSREKGLLPLLRGTASLGCCRGPEVSLEMCAAIVVAYRDQFGHGERDTVATKDWERERETYLRQLRLCRVAEAQVRLSAWGLQHLGHSK